MRPNCGVGVADESEAGFSPISSHLIAVGIPEVHDGERRAPARVVDDILHYALDVAVPLGVVYGPESGRPLPVLRVGLENGASTLPLGANNAAHFRKIFQTSARKGKRPEKEECEVSLTVLSFRDQRHITVLSESKLLLCSNPKARILFQAVKLTL